MRWSRSRWVSSSVLASVAGIGAAALVGALLAPVRDDIGLANVALLLVVVVVVAGGFGGRTAGLSTAAAASVWFNVLHTTPYGSLVIERRQDALTAFLVAVVGAAAGELAHLRLRAARRARWRDWGLQRVHRVSEMIARGDRFDDVVSVIEDEISGELRARASFVAEAVGPDQVELGHNGLVGVDHSDRVVLLDAPGPVTIGVRVRGREVGRIDLDPRDGRPVTLGQRVVAVALADMAGVATLNHPDDGQQVAGRGR